MGETSSLLSNLTLSEKIFELSSCLCSTNLECKKYCGIDGCIDIENQISNNICQKIIKENKEK